MTFAREKRLLLGLLAALAPIPLPFNEVLAWPALVAYELVVVAFLLRARRDPGGWLPAWAMNLLAVAYLPYFVFDLRVLSQGRLVSPVTHLLLFTVLVKLFALRRERDKWQTAIAIFFLFLTSMATSVHPTITLYLVVFLGAALLLFTRFAQLHLVAGFTHGADEYGALLKVPVGRFLVLATITTLLLSGPLFVLMPRVRNPLVTGSGRGMGTLGAATGFSEGVTLDTIGSIRASREVAMRLRYEGAPPPGHELRYRGGAYEVYKRGSWTARDQGRGRFRWGSGRWGSALRLAEAEQTTWVDVFLRPVTGNAVPVPLDAASIQKEQGEAALFVDGAGVVRRVGGGSRPFEYRVGIAAGPGLPYLSGIPGGEGGEVPESALDTGAVSPRVAGLAAEVAGGGPPEDQARRLERFLMTEYEYSLDFLGQGTGADPVETFLFERRSGHCEYFASSMALMLRAVGIPSRLATGFLGAEYNPLERYYVVRQSNAHAWVEAYLPEAGWTTFDPTPPSGRPAVDRSGLGSLLSQGWDYVLFRWDRYVLTYGFNDQMQFLAMAYGFWRDLGAFFGRDGDDERVSAPAAPWAERLAREAEAEPRVGPSPWAPPASILGVLGIVALLGTLVAVRRARRPLSGTQAYRRLRQMAGRAGLPVRDTDPPLGFARTLARHFPGAGPAGGEVVGLYVKESYGGQALADAEAARLQDVLSEAARALRKAG